MKISRINRRVDFLRDGESKRTITMLRTAAAVLSFTNDNAAGKFLVIYKRKTGNSGKERQWIYRRVL